MASMAKTQGSKTTGGSPPKKRFGQKAAPKTYEADGKAIEAFCKRRENRELGLADLTREACNKLGFNTKSFNAVKSYINSHGLVSAAAKAAGKESKKPEHAKIDLKTVKVGDMITVQKGYAVPIFYLGVRSDHPNNEHPNSAALHGEPVQIVGEGKAAEDAAIQKAYDRNSVILSYVKGHDAEFVALLEELETSDPERYERLVKIKEKYDDVSKFRFETGRRSCDVDGATIVIKPSGERRLVVNVKGAFEGDSDDDTPEGQDRIRDKVRKSGSTRLQRRAATAPAGAALKNGASLASVAAATDFTAVPPERRAARAAGAKPPPPPPQAAPQSYTEFYRGLPPKPKPVRRKKRAEKDRDAEAALQACLATEASARRHGLKFASSEEVLEDYAEICEAYAQENPPANRATGETWDMITGMARVCTVHIEAGDIDAPRKSFPVPAPPSQMIGMMGAADEVRKAFEEVQAGRWQTGATVGEDELVTFGAELTAHADRTGLLKDLLEVEYGGPFSDDTYARIKPRWELFVLLDYNDADLSVPVPEGVVLWPTTFAKRWRRGMDRPGWGRYAGAGRVDYIATKVKSATDNLRAAERAGAARRK